MGGGPYDMGRGPYDAGLHLVMGWGPHGGGPHIGGGHIVGPHEGRWYLGARMPCIIAAGIPIIVPQMLVHAPRQAPHKDPGPPKPKPELHGGGPHEGGGQSGGAHDGGGGQAAE